MCKQGGRNCGKYESYEKFKGGGVETLSLLSKEVWIWGVGETASRYQKSFVNLRKNGVNIQGYCDNNSEWWGKRYNGLLVISPEKLIEKKDIVVLICSLQKTVIREVGAQLTSMQKEWYAYDKAVYMLYRRELLQCYELLKDNLSKKTYQTMILERIQGGDKTGRPFNADDILCGNYCLEIAAFDKIDKDEIYIDCGAYVGDTIEKYLFKKFGVCKQIIGFEPDEISFCALSERRSRLLKEWGMKDDKIQIYQMAVGAEKGNVKFASTELDGRTGGMIGNEGKTVQMIALDDFMTERYSQIKIDTIGSELDILRGAQKSIKKWKPNIVVAMAYRAEDVFEIPLFLYDLVPEYKFAVRHHRNCMEMMLYAWTE